MELYLAPIEAMGMFFLPVAYLIVFLSGIALGVAGNVKESASMPCCFREPIFPISIVFAIILTVPIWPLFSTSFVVTYTYFISLVLWPLLLITMALAGWAFGKAVKARITPKTKH